MAAPTVVQTSQGATSAVNTTSHAITMPSGITTGNLLFAVFSVDGNTACTPTSGWTRIQRRAQSANVTESLFYKYATGSDSLTITTDANEQSSHIVYELANAAPPIVEMSDSNTGEGDPANNDTGISRDYLWLVTHSSDSTVVASAAPTNYGNLLTQAAAGTGGASTSTAYRTNTASSENPGTWTGTSAEQWADGTVAFGPKDSYYLAVGESPTGANDNSYGSIAWSNPTNIASRDASYASVTQSGTTSSNYLKATVYGFSVPTSATILGVKTLYTKVRNGGTTGQSTDDVIKLVKAGSVVGNNKAVTANWITTDDEFPYGGAADLWGTTLAPSDVNDSGFGSVIATKGVAAGSDRVSSVDNVRILVYYILPTSQTATGKSRIEKAASQTQTGKGRIEKASTQTQSGKSRVENAATNTQQGTARIEKQGSQTIPGLSRLEKSNTQTTQGLSRIDKYSTQEQQGKASIAGVSSQSVQGAASVVSQIAPIGVDVIAKLRENNVTISLDEHNVTAQMREYNTIANIQ